MTAAIEEIEVSKHFRLTFDKHITKSNPRANDGVVIGFTEATLILEVEKTSEGVWQSKRKLGLAPTLLLHVPNAVYMKNGQPTKSSVFDATQIRLGAATVPLAEVHDQALKDRVQEIVKSFWFQLP